MVHMSTTGAVRVPKSRFKPGRSNTSVSSNRNARKSSSPIAAGRWPDHPIGEDDEPDLQALRGLVIKYVDPLEPVAGEDWEAAR